MAAILAVLRGSVGLSPPDQSTKHLKCCVFGGGRRRRHVLCHADELEERDERGAS